MRNPRCGVHPTEGAPTPLLLAAQSSSSSSKNSSMSSKFKSSEAKWLERHPLAGWSPEKTNNNPLLKGKVYPKPHPSLHLLPFLTLFAGSDDSKKKTNKDQKKQKREDQKKNKIEIKKKQKTGEEGKPRRRG